MKNTYFSLAPTKVTHFTSAPTKVIICGKQKKRPGDCSDHCGWASVLPSLEWGGRRVAVVEVGRSWSRHYSQQLSSLATALESGSTSPMPSEGVEGGESPLSLREVRAAREEGGSSRRRSESSHHRSRSRRYPRKRHPVGNGWWHGGSTQP
jgi:hypothetical protein